MKSIQLLTTATVLLVAITSCDKNGTDSDNGHECPVIYSSGLSDGWGMGVNSSENRTDWLEDHDDYMMMAYPSGQEWGAVFITYGGDPVDPPRPGKDLSACKRLLVEFSGEIGGEEVQVGLKDKDDPDDGTEARCTIVCDTNWVEHQLDLNKFHTANLSRLYAIVFVFEDEPGRTVYFRSVRFDDSPVDPNVIDPPMAAFVYDVDGNVVTFTDQSTDNGVIQEWQWAFGDGSSSTEQYPVHQYGEAGDYAVTLTVTDDECNSDSFTDTVTIADATGNMAPVASFEYTVEGNAVQFTETSSDSDGSIVAWSWRFGDGEASDERNPEHTYITASDYEVMLVVTDDSGAVDTATHTVELYFDYVVYSDLGLVENSDVWTWDGSDWGMADGDFNGSYPDPTAPEGDTCFWWQSGSGGGNYAGWGVFLITPSDHTVDLSGYTHLQFWVKTTANLKVEIQRTNRNGSKCTVRIGSYGWDGTDTWQQITIPATAFSASVVLQ